MFYIHKTSLNDDIILTYMLFLYFGKMIACIHPEGKIFLCSFCRRAEVAWWAGKSCAVLWLLIGCICVNKGISLTFFYTNKINLHKCAEREFNKKECKSAELRNFWYQINHGLSALSVDSRHTYSKFHYLEISSMLWRLPSWILNFRPV